MYSYRHRLFCTIVPLITHSISVGINKGSISILFHANESASAQTGSGSSVWVECGSVRLLNVVAWLGTSEFKWALERPHNVPTTPTPACQQHDRQRHLRAPQPAQGAIIGANAKPIFIQANGSLEGDYWCRHESFTPVVGAGAAHPDGVSVICRMLLGNCVLKCSDWLVAQKHQARMWLRRQMFLKKHFQSDGSLALLCYTCCDITDRDRIRSGTGLPDRSVNSQSVFTPCLFMSDIYMLFVIISSSLLCFPLSLCKKTASLSFFFACLWFSPSVQRLLCRQGQTRNLQHLQTVKQLFSDTKTKPSWTFCLPHQKQQQLMPKLEQAQGRSHPDWGHIKSLCTYKWRLSVGLYYCYS